MHSLQQPPNNIRFGDFGSPPSTPARSSDWLPTVSPVLEYHSTVGSPITTPQVQQLLGITPTQLSENIHNSQVTSDSRQLISLDDLVPQTDTLHTTARLPPPLVSVENAITEPTMHIFYNNKHYIFTCVQGTKFYGLLIDPGASKGLIGMDTVRDIIRYVLKPAGKAHLVTWSPSTATFSGISAKTETALSKVKFPIGLLGMSDTWYEADVIGGTASTCPGLVPLKTLLRRGCIISCGYFVNKDGILGIRNKGSPGGFAAQRLYFTDSGHYLLTINHFGKPANAGLNKAITFENSQLRSATKQTHGDGDDDNEASVLVVGSAEEEQVFQ